jgi:hypothetical protein
VAHERALQGLLSFLMAAVSIAAAPQKLEGGPFTLRAQASLSPSVWSFFGVALPPSWDTPSAADILRWQRKDRWEKENALDGHTYESQTSGIGVFKIAYKSPQ